MHNPCLQSWQFRQMSESSMASGATAPQLESVQLRIEGPRRSGHLAGQEHAMVGNAKPGAWPLLQIRAMVVTTNEVGDSSAAAELLGQIPNHETVSSFTGDGAYDTQVVYEACHQRQTLPIIPPRKEARLRKGSSLYIAKRR